MWRWRLAYHPSQRPQCRGQDMSCTSPAPAPSRWPGRCNPPHFSRRGSDCKIQTYCFRSSYKSSFCRINRSNPEKSPSAAYFSQVSLAVDSVKPQATNRATSSEPFRINLKHVLIIEIRRPQGGRRRVPALVPYVLLMIFSQKKPPPGWFPSGV